MTTIEEQKTKLEQKKARMILEEARLKIKERKMRTRALIELLRRDLSIYQVKHYMAHSYC